MWNKVVESGALGNKSNATAATVRFQRGFPRWQVWFWV